MWVRIKRPPLHITTLISGSCLGGDHLQGRITDHRKRTITKYDGGNTHVIACDYRRKARVFVAHLVGENGLSVEGAEALNSDFSTQIAAFTTKLSVEVCATLPFEHSAHRHVPESVCVFRWQRAASPNN